MKDSIYATSVVHRVINWSGKSLAQVDEIDNIVDVFILPEDTDSSVGGISLLGVELENVTIVFGLSDGIKSNLDVLEDEDALPNLVFFINDDSILSDGVPEAVVCLPEEFEIFETLKEDALKRDVPWVLKAFDKVRCEGITFNLLLHSQVDFFIKCYREIKAKEISEKVFTSRHANTFLIDAAKAGKRVKAKNFLETIQSSRYFYFSNPQSLLFASTILQNQWHNLVGMPMLMSDDKYLANAFVTNYWACRKMKYGAENEDYFGGLLKFITTAASANGQTVDWQCSY